MDANDTGMKYHASIWCWMHADDTGEEVPASLVREALVGVQVIEDDLVKLGCCWSVPMVLLPDSIRRRMGFAVPFRRQAIVLHITRIHNA
jgi:hypothetical protein